MKFEQAQCSPEALDGTRYRYDVNEAYGDYDV